MSERTLKIFSGKSCQCDVGIPVDAFDMEGKPIHTGDIVIVWRGEYVGTDQEWWHPSSSLTAVVSDQYQSFSDGTVTSNTNPKPFVMGIKDCGFNHPQWNIQVVKKYSDAIDGEHWRAYGFNYGFSDAADASRAEAH